jgi:lysine 6-dehydrogenase
LHGEGKTIEYNLLDFYDSDSNTSSMARSTGYTCTACVNLLANKLFEKKGIFPPEMIGSEKICFDFVFNYLKERGVNWTKKNNLHHQF